MSHIILLKLLLVMGAYVNMPWTELTPDRPIASIVDNLDFEELIMVIEEELDVEIPMSVSNLFADELSVSSIDRKDRHSRNYKRLTDGEFDELIEKLSEEDGALLGQFQKIRQTHTSPKTVSDFVSIVYRYIQPS